jgi:hypothetical protein
VLARCATALSLGFVTSVYAQFTPLFLQNDSYWGDGKAEFDLYDAQVLRDGGPRGAEMTLVFMREVRDPKTAARVVEPKTGPSEQMIRMTRSLPLPRGLFLEQQLLDAFWRAKDGHLVQLVFQGSDMLDTVAKHISENTGSEPSSWKLDFVSSGAGSSTTTSKPATGKPVIFYDELPLRVRTMDFRKTNDEFEILLLPTIVSAKKDSLEGQPARISWKSSDRQIEIEVRHEAGVDRFKVDATFPFLLREWQAADGGRFKLKNSLKVKYWDYNKPGDRERALKDPMLRHPD